jgi:hypothetical protein
MEGLIYITFGVGISEECYGELSGIRESRSWRLKFEQII